MPTAEEFRQAFIEEWQNELTCNYQRLLNAWHSDWESWTVYMQKGENTFLKRVAERLELSMAIEWFKLDAIYYDAQTDFHLDQNKVYPSHLAVYIEHETGGDPEKEMYKLLMWPAALKVLIFYDWADFKKENNVRNQQWHTNKLIQMFEMGREVDRRRSGAEETEYLFLLSQPPGQGKPPQWRSWHVTGENWPDNPGLGCSLIL